MHTNVRTSKVIFSLEFLLINKEEVDNQYLTALLTNANLVRFRVRIMVFNSTFKNISVISWRSVLLVEETRVPRENH